MKNPFSKAKELLTAQKLVAKDKLEAQELLAEEKQEAEELTAKNKVEASAQLATDKLIANEIQAHTIIVEKLEILHKRYVNTVLAIIGVFIAIAIISTVVILRTPKIARIGSIEKDVTFIKNDISGLFTIAKINKTNDSIRDVNYEHLPKFLPIPPENMTKISSVFGKRNDGYHMGTDYATKTGTPVYAAASGMVTKASWNDGYGNVIDIDHKNKVITRYGHLSKFLVTVGEMVYQGELIAFSGNTGDSSGPHLHFEIIINDRNINPGLFIQI